MSSPSIGTVTFDTMNPPLMPSQAQWIDQQSTGRDGTDCVLDAYRAGVQTVTTATVTDTYAAALAERITHLETQAQILAVVDDTGTTYADTLVRQCRPTAWAQADGTGLVLTEWDLLIKSSDTPPAPPAPPTPPPEE